MKYWPCKQVGWCHNRWQRYSFLLYKKGYLKRDEREIRYCLYYVYKGLNVLPIKFAITTEEKTFQLHTCNFIFLSSRISNLYFHVVNKKLWANYRLDSYILIAKRLYRQKAKSRNLHSQILRGCSKSNKVISGRKLIFLMIKCSKQKLWKISLKKFHFQILY